MADPAAKARALGLAYYTAPAAPGPRVVDICAREKGLDLAAVERCVDARGGENRRGEHLERNPAGQLPYFELEDGNVVAETIAMVELLEELVPEPPLVGATPTERAQTRMWQRRMEENYISPAISAYRFWTASEDCEGFWKGFYEGRAPVLLPSVYKEMRAWALGQLQWLEALKQKAPSEFICGSRLTMVDVQVFCTLDAYKDKSQPFLAEHGADLPWLQAWSDRMCARESVQASTAHAEEVMRNVQR